MKNDLLGLLRTGRGGADCATRYSLVFMDRSTERAATLAFPEREDTILRPLLRGVLHEVAFFVALVIGILFGLYASGARASVGAAIFAASVVLMFGASALYHRVWWSD